MRFLPTCALLLSLSAIPGFCQSHSAPNTNSNTNTALPANANDASVDYAALRERLAEQNKVLTDQVNTQRSIVKKNQELLKEAQKLDASNKKLMEEKKKLETENVDLEKQRMALKSSQSQTQTAQVSN
jgi:predicted nuclease with TOPRIM domain